MKRSAPMRPAATCAALLSGIAVASAAALVATAQDAPSADRARRAAVYARGEGLTLTVGDVEDYLAAQPAYVQSQHRTPEQVRALAEKLLRFELLAREAERRGFGAAPKVVRAHRELLVQELIRVEFDERITPASITAEEVRAYFGAHAEELSHPETVRAAHILFADRESALALLPRAREADLAGFQALAREHSIDGETKLRGGDLHYFARDGRLPRGNDAPVDPALVEAAFGLAEVGDVVSEPVPVGAHFSVVKLTGRRPAEGRTLEELEQGIRLRLWRKKRQEGIEALVARLRREHPPEVHPELVDAIQLDAPPRGARGHAHDDESVAPAPSPAAHVH